MDAGDDPAGTHILADEMARFGNDREAPARSVLGMLGDRWTTLILLVLREGEIRHAALKRAIETLSFEGAISQRVLTLKLRALERDGFVVRSVSEDVPPRVSYALTPLGAELGSRARGMIDWINGCSESIRKSRERYDEDDAGAP